MTVFYLDLENGNDANDGLTFANRWKTFNSGPTAARIGPGDEIRVMASPDPTTPGNATWTDNSGTITWASGKNKLLDNCETAWTAATNITTATSTSSKQGTNCVQITPGSAFTTGKMAYKALGSSVDLSAYQQVSLWVRYGALTAAGQMELRLCSDTTGDVAVNTLALPAGNNGAWRVVVLNNAAALGGAIQSIALYATADPGTTAISLDNIVACKAANAADCVTHAHVIGKNTGPEPDWYSILALDDTTVTLGAAFACAPGTTNPPPVYRGTTETVATYVLLGIDYSATLGALQEHGDIDAGAITYSGGWDRTAMTTQSGQTYLNGYHFGANALRLAGKKFIKLRRFGGLNFRDALLLDDVGCQGLDLDLAQGVGCTAGLFNATISSIGPGVRYKFDSMQGLTATFNPLASGPGDTSLGRWEIIGRRLHGNSTSTTVAGLSVVGGVRYALDRIDNCRGYGVSQAGLKAGQRARLSGTTFENNINGDFDVAGNGELNLYDCATASTPGSGGSRARRLTMTRVGGSTTDHRIFGPGYSIYSDPSTRHTASGLAWQISLSQSLTFSADFPVVLPLGKVAVKAGALVTVKCWLRRNDAAMTAGIRILSDSLPGVGHSDLVTTMTAAINTWEEITLTFTPTVAGVVDIEGVAWSSTAFITAWFDDLTITQA